MAFIVVSLSSELIEKDTMELHKNIFTEVLNSKCTLFTGSIYNHSSMMSHIKVKMKELAFGLNIKFFHGKNLVISSSKLLHL